MSVAGTHVDQLRRPREFPRRRGLHRPGRSTASNGQINFSFPAVHHGRECDGVRLTFKNGKVVDASAEQGRGLPHLHARHGRRQPLPRRVRDRHELRHHPLHAQHALRRKDRRHRPLRPRRRLPRDRQHEPVAACTGTWSWTCATAGTSRSTARRSTSTASSRARISRAAATCTPVPQRLTHAMSARAASCTTSRSAHPPRDAADLPAINAIYNHYVLHSTCTYQEEPETMHDRRAWFAAHGPAAPGDRRAARRARSSAGGRSRPTTSGRRTAARWRTPSTSPTTHHGRGIGRLLLPDLIDRAEAIGHHTIIAGIDAEQTREHRAARDDGFRRGRPSCARSASSSTGGCDVRYMQLML